MSKSEDLKLENVSLADRGAIAEIIARANFDDPYGQTVWPDSTIESRIAGSHARLPKTLLGPGNWFQKVTQGGKPVAYAQWTLPIPLWERLNRENGGGIDAEADTQMRDQFNREYNGSCVSPGWPKGMRREVVEACSPAMEEANERVFSGDGDAICTSTIFLIAKASNRKPVLVQVKTLPEYQGRGAGSMLVGWGADLADREGLPTHLEATPFGKGLYEKYGFANMAEVHHDVSRSGGPARYTHTLMIRKPAAV